MIGEFTEYITKDGLVYHFDSDDRFLISEEGTGMPPMEYITQKGPEQHGETLIDYRLGKRTIQLVMRQDSYSRFDYWTQRHNLVNFMRPNRSAVGSFGPGTLRKYRPDGSIRDLKAIIEFGPVFAARKEGVWDEFGFTEVLRFVAHDPIFFDPIQRSILWDSLTDEAAAAHLLFPTLFPLELGALAYSATRSLIYTGTWPSFPVITITGPQNGFTITNISTDEKIEFNYNIAAGEIVRISLSYGNKTIVNQAGTNLLGVITSDSDLVTFHIASDPEVAGGINTFTVSSTGTTAASQVLLEYYTRYIGI